ncbi:FAD-binding oxidoreductase [Hydrogenophaga sp.]|uniref:NAD(P)/FAD-dependent oxidoreductase n=1 Tax=Hydrogenophaga sp. TaxID=1904254 RepID=UPI0027264091|nr:FAD-binding oxidoreductase [Hydrogenophaga sp.]MDO9506433.1 FAD-binding oxidoreductase [Hydrogenophaga sp.]
MFKPDLLHSDTLLNQRSYYEASVQRGPAQPPLQGEQRADVLVVGGGLAGLSAALELAERGLQVCLLEAQRIGWGASGRNGGQALVGYACGQAPLEQQLGRADARRLWDWTLEGIELLGQRIARHQIDCDWQRGYLTVADSPRQAKRLLADAEQQQRDYGLACELATGPEVRRHIDSPRYHAAAYETLSGHLHPLKYTLGLAQAAQRAGVALHEHSTVQRLSHHAAGVTAHTASGQVTARHALLAGNCLLPEYASALAPALGRRIMPVGTYLIATAPVAAALCRRLIPRAAAVCDNNLVLDYFRFSAGQRLLFGGRVSYTTHTPQHLQQLMRQRMLAVFPDLAQVPVEYLWGGFVDISMNRAPDFGRLSPQVYYLQGFSGHGVVLAGLAGRLVAEAISGQAGRFDVYARLQHHNFPGGPRLRTPLLALGMAWQRLREALG